MTKKQYDHSFIISDVKSLQCIAKELGEKPNKPDEQNLDSYPTKIRTIPILLALAVELGLKALYCQETKKEPLHTHDLIVLFDDLGENTQAELESAFEKLGGNTRGRLEAMLPNPPSKMLRYVLHENKDVFKDWRYSFEHVGLLCYTGDLDRVISVIIETYYKFSR